MRQHEVNIVVPIALLGLLRVAGVNFILKIHKNTETWGIPHRGRILRIVFKQMSVVICGSSAIPGAKQQAIAGIARRHHLSRHQMFLDCNCS